MLERRRLVLGSLAAVAAPRVGGAPVGEAGEIDRLGKFELVLGRPGVVIGVPHGTADVGTLEVGRILRERLGTGGVFVTTGFWNGQTRERINVNRPTEQVIGPESQVLRQWSSDRAVAANRRYDALVKEAAQGRLKVFWEIHTNHRPELAGSIEVSTLGVSHEEAERLKSAFAAARKRLAKDVPRLAIHVSPADKVTYPNYGNASTISKLSERGCAIEGPGSVFAKRPLRLVYADCLADAIAAAKWG